MTCIILIYDTILHFILLCLKISSVNWKSFTIDSRPYLSSIEAMPATFELHEMAHAQAEGQHRRNLNV